MLMRYSCVHQNMDRRVKDCLRHQAHSVRSLDHQMDTSPQTTRTWRNAEQDQLWTSPQHPPQVTKCQSLGWARVGRILSSRVSQTQVGPKFKCPGSRSTHTPRPRQNMEEAQGPKVSQQTRVTHWCDPQAGMYADLGQRWTEARLLGAELS